jgi:ABC-type Fe3+ transport system permease subunit
MGKSGRILFDRPKPTAGCSASGRRRRRIRRRRGRRRRGRRKRRRRGRRRRGIIIIIIIIIIIRCFYMLCIPAVFVHAFLLFLMTKRNTSPQTVFFGKGF